MEALGIDISHYQKNIDWAKVKRAGKKFAIIKCQYETSHKKDEYFEANYKGCIENGLDCGVYIYIGSKSVQDPEEDALRLLENLNGRTLTYGIWLDCEDAKLKKYGKNNWTKLIETYTTIFEAAGYRVGIYCNRDWYNNVLDSAKLKLTHDFWIARYPKNDTGKYNPDSALSPKKYSVAWQYSSKGKVPGINGNVDLNVDFDGVTDLLNVDKKITGCPYTKPNETLRIGASGDGVKWVQWMLNHCGIGYNIPVTGLFDQLLAGAVIDFEKRLDLSVDSGNVGNQVKKALENLVK